MLERPFLKPSDHYTTIFQQPYESRLSLQNDACKENNSEMAVRRFGGLAVCHNGGVAVWWWRGLAAVQKRICLMTLPEDQLAFGTKTHLN